MRNNSTWTPSAPSPIVWPTDAWDAPLTIVAAIGAVALFILPSVIYVVIALSLGYFDPRHPYDHPEQLLIAQAVAYLPIGIYLAAVVPQLAHVQLRELGFRRVTARDLGIALTGTAAMYLVVALANVAMTALTHRHDTEAAVDLLRRLSSPGQRLLFVAVACVLAPMIEELMFRFFLFNALTRYLPLVASAAVSGIVFGAIHSQSPGELATVGIPLGCGGIILAYVYAISRSYWASVITHATFNAISVFAIIFFNAS